MSHGDLSALDFTGVSDNKPAAGLLGFFCGSLGIHKIVLGSTKETLENQRLSRDNGPVIAGQYWIDGR